MEIAVICIFILGYLAIALEHPLHIDKAASALIAGVLCWTIYALSQHAQGGVDHGLLEHLSEIASILFFLMGAMTIVELIDAHDGFKVITDVIKTTKKVELLWIVGLLTFFLSAVLDNLTTTIVMVSLLRKLIGERKERWIFVGIVVIAANAGGAWSPIGDVTTTMLWIKDQLPGSFTIISHLFLPSLVAISLPMLILSFRMKGHTPRPVVSPEDALDTDPSSPFERRLILFLGIGGLLFVPIFKTVTHLEPFMGMMLSLGSLWVLTEIIHRNKNNADRIPLSVAGVLRKIDQASVLFFLGILLAVGALQDIGILGQLAQFLDEKIGNIYIINISIGFLSSIIDNVPLVAAGQGMYPIAASGPFMQNGIFWQFLAYCAGTGGSCLIIGSAAGVAAMGLEKMDFIWYFKRMSLLAVVGYLAGAGVYMLMF